MGHGKTHAPQTDKANTHVEYPPACIAGAFLSDPRENRTAGNP
jgi:hypothetical protein